MADSHHKWGELQAFDSHSEKMFLVITFQLNPPLHGEFCDILLRHNDQTRRYTVRFQNSVAQKREMSQTGHAYDAIILVVANLTVMFN